jgi:four helix bundle protein
MNRSDLEERCALFALNVFAFCSKVRTRPGGLDPANQLQCAASSVAANYRATARARSPKEFVAKIGLVNEEADETVYWLEFIRDTHLANGGERNLLYLEARELRAIFAASYATARRHLNE